MNSQPKQCHACLANALSLKTYSRVVEHHGKTGAIRQSKWECSNCHIALFDDACAKDNRRAWIAFQKHVDGVPTGVEIKALRNKLGLTSEAAGNILGGGPKAFSKYENEEIIPQGAMRTLLALLIKFPHVMALIQQSKAYDIEAPISPEIYRVVASGMTLQLPASSVPFTVVDIGGSLGAFDAMASGPIAAGKAAEFTFKNWLDTPTPNEKTH